MLQTVTLLYGRRIFFRPQAATEVNLLTPELNPSAQRCLTRVFTGEFFFLNRAFR
jgi:hypothetical protein